MLSEEEVADIEAEAKEKEVASIVSYLKREIGNKITAYIAGLDSKTLNKLIGWSIGVENPTKVEEMRLRYAYHAIKLVILFYSKETAKTFLFGRNQFLDDEAPAEIVRNGRNKKDLQEVVSAAKGFIWPA